MERRKRPDNYDRYDEIMSEEDFQERRHIPYGRRVDDRPMYCYPEPSNQTEKGLAPREWLTIVGLAVTVLISVGSLYTSMNTSLTTANLTISNNYSEFQSHIKADDVRYGELKTALKEYMQHHAEETEEIKKSIQTLDSTLTQVYSRINEHARIK